MTSMMSRNLDKIWLYHSTLQEKEQQLNRYSEQKIRLYQEKSWERKTSNAMNELKKTNRICILLNYLNWRILEWINQKKNLTK